MRTLLLVLFFVLFVMGCHVKVSMRKDTHVECNCSTAPPKPAADKKE